MNIFGYFPLFQSFTFCKSTSDIKKIQNKMAATQVALLLLSSILVLLTDLDKRSNWRPFGGLCKASSGLLASYAIWFVALRALKKSLKHFKRKARAKVKKFQNLRILTAKKNLKIWKS